MRILVIYNPTAGGSRRRLFQRTLARLTVEGAAVTVRRTATQGDARSLAGAGSIAAWDVVVVAGGDGTINEVINGLPPDPAPLAIIPCGTANVMAAELGLGRRADDLAETILAGRPLPATIGLAGRRRFVMMAGVGFDAHAVAGVNVDLKRRFGKAAYGLEVLRQACAFDFPHYRLTVDGRDYGAASVIVANGRYYAGRFIVAAQARLADPRFQVCLFTRPGRWNFLRYGMALGLGRLARLADVEIVAGTEIDVIGPTGEPVQADGDIVGQLPIRIRLAEQPLTLLAPAKGG